MTKPEIREMAKDFIQKALSSAYYKVSDDPDEYDLTEDEADEVVKAMNQICEQLCKRMGRKHYTVEGR